MLKITPAIYESCMAEFTKDNFHELLQSIEDENPGLINMMQTTANSVIMDEQTKGTFLALSAFFYKLFRKSYELEQM